MKFYRYIISLVVLFFLISCEGNSPKPSEKMLQAKGSHNNQQVDSGKIEGRVVILQNAVLPKNAIVTITLADTSFVELPALILSQKYYDALDNRPTIPFELTYHKNEVREGAKILVSASVSSDGKLLYLSNSDFEVITNGVTENIELLVVPAN